MYDGRGFQFQKWDINLVILLREILHTHEERHLIGIHEAVNKSYRSQMNQEGADWWNKVACYCLPRWCMWLERSRVYYSANFTRYYSEQQDKADADVYFDLVKKIWDDRAVLLIEGQFTRFGIGNDLLDNARRVERVLIPNESAFEKYVEI